METPAPRAYRIGEFTLDLDEYRLVNRGRNIPLQPKTFATLRCLVERYGRLVTKRELHDQVWGDVAVSDSALSRCIVEVRKALGDDAMEPRYLQTVPRLGYRFIGSVEAVEPSSRGRPAARAEGRTVRSLVVLPFVNLSREPEQEYFADGFTDLLIADLGRIAALEVVSRTSAMCYRTTMKRMPEIARELRVDSAVEGSILRAGDRVRITVQLIDARSDSQFFPVWAREEGPQQFAAMLKDPATRLKIKQDSDFQTWVHEHGSWEGIVLGRARQPQNRKYEGMRLAQIAKLRGDADPADTCLTLMAEEGGTISGIFHAMSEQDVRTVMKLPWVAIASDGSALNLTEEGFPHPRSYSTNVRVLGHYVRDERVLTLEDAVRKMTSLPAQILGLRDRGQVREGFAADVVVFDPATVAETNSFEKPKSYAAGVRYAIVNGVIVIDGGNHTGARPGRALKGRAAPERPVPER
jgi:TolB-like protein